MVFQVTTILNTWKELYMEKIIKVSGLKLLAHKSGRNRLAWTGAPYFFSGPNGAENPHHQYAGMLEPDEGESSHLVHLAKGQRSFCYGMVSDRVLDDCLR